MAKKTIPSHAYYTARKPASTWLDPRSSTCCWPSPLPLLAQRGCRVPSRQPDAPDLAEAGSRERRRSAPSSVYRRVTHVNTTRLLPREIPPVEGITTTKGGG